MTTLFALRIFGPTTITKLAAATGLSWSEAGNQAMALLYQGLVECPGEGWRCSLRGRRMVDHHEVAEVARVRDEARACVGVKP